MLILARKICTYGHTFVHISDTTYIYLLVATAIVRFEYEDKMSAMNRVREEELNKTTLMHHKNSWHNNEHIIR